jgi:hypothetical protein
LKPNKTFNIPDVPEMKEMTLPLPTADVPFYKPLVVPPSDLRPPDGVKSEAEDEQPTGIREVKLPVLNFKVPVPENEILITAGTTAVVSVAATLTATAAFKWAVTTLKPILKTTWKKLSQSKKKGSLAK